jgi:antirestriction protein
MNEQEPTTTNNENEGAAERRPEAKPRVPPRIYVASLSDYNAGRLHGVWLDADDDEGTLHEGVHAMLDASPEPHAEEYAIHDYENFGPLRLGEFDSLDSVCRIGRGIAEHGMAFAHWASLVGSGNVDALEHFEDAYLGHYDDLEAYGDSLIDDFGIREVLEEAVPQHMACFVHVDAAAFGRDLDLSGDITTSAGDGGIYVFDGTV